MGKLRPISRNEALSQRCARELVRQVRELIERASRHRAHRDTSDAPRASSVVSTGDALGAFLVAFERCDFSGLRAVMDPSSLQSSGGFSGGRGTYQLVCRLPSWQRLLASCSADTEVQDASMHADPLHPDFAEACARLPALGEVEEFDELLVRREIS